MHQFPARIISVFKLTFWWEPHHGGTGNWRGHVSHDQLEREIAVNSPEDAFQIVRETLACSSKTFAAGARSAVRTGEQRLCGASSNVLFSIWRRLWGERP
jgi:hypothetical protein